MRRGWVVLALMMTGAVACEAGSVSGGELDDTNQRAPGDDSATEQPDDGSPAGPNGDPTGGDGQPGDPIVVGDLTIPSAHPRLWWTPERLAEARDWYASHAFAAPATVNGADRAIEAALHSLLTETTTGCDRAVAWAMSVDFSCPGVACDPARWDGEGAIVTFDWCFDRFSPTQRQTFIDRWNGITTDLNDNDWGGIGMEGNNYYLGYLRNTIELALATWEENAQAQALLDYALDVRWETSLRPYLDGAAAGGAPHEGSAYGRRVFAYLTIPFDSLANHGRRVWDETPYFRESLYWIIYSTTPGLSLMPNGAQVYETFPFNEDERWLERDISAENTAQTTLGTYMAPLAAHWRDDAVAGHVAAFLELTGHAIDERFAASTSTAALDAAPSAPLSELPLDYFAPGLGMLYAKTDWSGGATFYNAQLRTPDAVGHEHSDAGTFQLWRAGRWLTRESVGYAQSIAGYGGTGSVDCASPVGHNAVLIGARGIASYRRGRPTVTRLSSDSVLSYVSVDMTDAFEVSDDWAHREDEVGNPAAGRVTRELLFVRPLETLVIFDRVESTSAGAVKTFLLHFENSPTAVDARTYEAIEGSQALRAITLVPASTTRRVVDEGGAVGQYRAEIETSGAAQSYFLHVVQAKAADGDNVTASLSETGSAFEVTLTHTTRGSAKLVLEKGATSSGGAFGYAAYGEAATQPLRSSVQPLALTESGPRWGD